MGSVGGHDGEIHKDPYDTSTAMNESVLAIGAFETFVFVLIFGAVVMAISTFMDMSPDFRSGLLLGIIVGLLSAFMLGLSHGAGSGGYRPNITVTLFGRDILYIEGKGELPDVAEDDRA
ncbi:MAG: hypothetical protein AB7S83_05825 [Candidatus Methanomethylophilaceae archaeon]